MFLCGCSMRHGLDASLLIFFPSGLKRISESVTRWVTSVSLVFRKQQAARISGLGYGGRCASLRETVVSAGFCLKAQAAMPTILSGLFVNICLPNM